MSEQNIFEQASRAKLLFQTSGGQYGVEDLWDLTLSTTRRNVVTLNSIAKGLHKKLKADEDVDFVDDVVVNEERAEWQLQFDIVLHIIKVKKAETLAKINKTAKAAKIKRLRELKANKENEAFNEMSADEIERMLQEELAA